MALKRLRRLISGETKGVHFGAVIFMGPLAAVAILALRQLGLVARTPIWLIPVILVGGQLVTTSAGLWWDRCHTRLRLHGLIASQTILVTAVIYATGWGPALAIGLVLMGQDALAVTGSSSQWVVLGWTLVCLAAGEGLIALGWVPSLIRTPEVHGLAVLMAIGIVFSYRSLHSALIDREQAAALTDQRERRFRALVQSSSDLVFAVDASRSITYASPSCTKVLGYEPEELLGSETGTLVHPDDFEVLLHTFLGIVDVPGGSIEFSIRVRHHNGTWRWLEGLATNLLDDPAVAGMVVNARDVTERRGRLERHTAMSDLGREILRSTTLDASVSSVVEVVNRIVGARHTRIVVVPESSHSDGRTAGPVPDSPAGLTGPGASDDPPSLRVPVGDPEQPLAYIEVYKDGLTTTAEEQFIEGVSGIVLSAIVRFGAEDAIRHQALHDPLTGLPNRVLFNDRLEHSLFRRSRDTRYIAVMVVDLDGFKNVNDSLGHLTGDALLVAVAERFSGRLRGFDTIARLGGDEFAILFDELRSPEEAEVIAQRVLNSLIIPLQLPEREVAIGASVGVALTNEPGTKAERLLADADAAMYRAKREGKGCYRVFEAAMYTASVERMNLEQELRTAIRDGALTVYYQPIVDTTTGRVSSFEALARWSHPTRGFIPPDSFIPLAEESGLIIDLGRFVLHQACQQAREWQSRFPELRPDISVNASGLQLASPAFVEQVVDSLRRADLDPSSLIIEITESILATESRPVLATLDELRRQGVRVAIDDFGTGYSSLAALADLPIDILKIDKRFIDNLVHDDQGRGFVKAILQLAATLHLETTAEGVEEAEQRDALAVLGCTHIQGYFFSRPLPAEETGDYLQRAGVGAGTSGDLKVTGATPAS